MKKWEEAALLPNGGISSKPWKPALLVLLLFSLLCLVGHRQIAGFDLRWMDSALRIRRDLGLAEPMADQIRIVEINDSDLLEFGTDGEYEAVAHALKELARLGSRSIVVDVLYLRGSDEQRKLLSTAITEAEQAYGTRFVLPGVIYRGETAADLRVSLGDLQPKTTEVGIINMQIDRDRLWRRYRDTHLFEGTTYPSLALAAYLTTLPSESKLRQGDRPGTLEWTELSEDFSSTTDRIADSRDRLLNFRDSYYSDKVDLDAGVGNRIWSLQDLRSLESLTASEQADSPFQGAVTFFGYGRGLDEKATSMGPQEPGMLLHAVALSDRMQGRALYSAGPFQNALLTLIVAAAAILLFRIRRKRWLLLGAAVGFLLIVGSSLYFIWYRNFVPSVTSAGSVWFLLLFAEIGRRHSVELVRRIRADTTMSYYFSEKVLQHVRDNPGSTAPREVDLTLLISDLRNYTTICEILPARETFNILSEVFGIQTRTAISLDGSLQHFWGDQFLAYWGAPEPQTDGADRALRAAILIREKLTRYRHTLPDSLKSDFGFGIGLHHGTGLVGNMGTEEYLDYSVFGDVVNSTARLESLTKIYGVDFLATRQFCHALSSSPPMRVLDRVHVAGKETESMEIIEIQSDESPAEFEKLRDSYEGAFALYQSGNFGSAREEFQHLASEFSDGPSEALADRCEKLIASPPVEWNGIFRFTGK